ADRGMIASAGKLLSIGLLLLGLAPALDSEPAAAAPPAAPPQESRPTCGVPHEYRALKHSTFAGAQGFDRAVGTVARVVGVESALLRAVGATESSGNPDARSAVGAIGLTQLMPVAIRQYGPEAGRLLGRRPDAHKGLDNLLMGALYYRDALRRSHGNIEHAARLYHGGPNFALHGPRTIAYGRKIAGRYRQLTRVTA